MSSVDGPHSASCAAQDNYANCSRTACNGWPLCDNGEGKSFARTAHVDWLAVHLHGIAEGTEWIRVRTALQWAADGGFILCT